jgi:hypothetical protein
MCKLLKGRQYTHGEISVHQVLDVLRLYGWVVVLGRRTLGDDAPPSGDATRRPPSART